MKILTGLLIVILAVALVIITKDEIAIHRESTHYRAYHQCANHADTADDMCYCVQIHIDSTYQCDEE